jgi:hypothetical protein
MPSDHRTLAEALRRATLEADADTPAGLRASVAARAAGGPQIPEPHDSLAREIGQSSSRVTDAQVAAVRNEVGSERAAFEIIAAATLGAGLKRWHAGLAALDEASHAPG